MWRTAISLVTAGLLLCAAASQAGELPKITHLRVGAHPAYDRLVLELESSAAIVWGTQGDEHAPLFEIGAKPLHPEVLETGLKRLGTLRVESIPAGTRLRLDSKRRRIRVFTLSNPPRIVIDLADPRNEPFEPPKGARGVRQQSQPSLASLTRPVEPGPRAPMAPPPRPASKPPAPPPPPAPEPEPPAKGAAVEVTRRSPFDPPTGELIARSLEAKGSAQQAVSESEASSPASAPRAEPSAAAQPRSEPKPAPVTAESNLPAPETAPKAAAQEVPARAAKPGKPAPIAPPIQAAKPEPRISPSEVGDRTVRWIGLAALTLVAFLLALGWLLRRPARGVSEKPLAVSSFPQNLSPETITPEELYRAGSRVEILDKRLDEEVRARMALEERMQHANEEIKVLRDRLARVERRRGA